MQKKKIDKSPRRFVDMRRLIEGRQFVTLSTTKHPFHLVEPSIEPILLSFSLFATLYCVVMYLAGCPISVHLLKVFVPLLIFSFLLWWHSVLIEGRKHHTKYVQNGLRLGMFLFILSEVMFFFSFFWAFFHYSISPDINIGGIWPPKGIEAIDPFELPLYNTLILLLSGATLTWSHMAVIANKRRSAFFGLLLTILLGILFTGCQVLEYLNASFSIADSVYGSIFFMATGFHGFHVIIGTLFLIICLIRLVNGFLAATHHVGFECAIWYWHFVDVVWLFLFVSIYWWGY